MASRFRNNLHFALRRETADIRAHLPANLIEKIGDKLSWFVYDFKDFVLKYFFDPRVITVCFTTIAMILTALLFYPSTTWDIISDSFQWIMDHVNWEYVRFCLWLVSEMTVLGIGMRAFGRFSNQELVKHYDQQSLVA